MSRAIAWLLQITAAAILAQTLFFKFTASAESVYIFTTLGVEPWGRIGSGVAELVAATLLLIPRTIVYGALLAAAVMAGAIASHLTMLGIVVQDDGGLLFGLGWAITGACPGPLFAQIGAGFPVILVTFLSAWAGTWVYGRLREQLPH